MLSKNHDPRPPPPRNGSGERKKMRCEKQKNQKGKRRIECSVREEREEAKEDIGIWKQRKLTWAKRR
ncbi:unnamed protein product [Dovyalis caffra]|uniref:Uncharacterized protein n=1 Tax=Dovyalis caffra TaxID=77055 RepID=A0AAV1QPQ6_9ROSI|nr:unnamed protein product [Dovyalis caffra]